MCQDSGRTSNSTINHVKICHFIRHSNITNTLTWQGQGLTPGITYQCVFIILRNIRNLQVPINQLTIWLIGDDKDRMTKFLRLDLQNICQLFDSFLRINNATRIVGAVNNYSLGLWTKHFLKFIKLNLKILRIGRHHLQLGTYRFHETAIFWEIWGKGKELIINLILMKSLEANSNGRSCTTGHKEIFTSKISAKTAVNAFGNGLTNLGITSSNCVTVESTAIHSIQNIYNRSFYSLWRRYIRIANGEIINIFLPYLSGSFSAIFKNRANCRFFCT